MYYFPNHGIHSAHPGFRQNTFQSPWNNNRPIKVNQLYFNVITINHVNFCTIKSAKSKSFFRNKPAFFTWRQQWRLYIAASIIPLVERFGTPTVPVSNEFTQLLTSLTEDHSDAYCNHKNNDEFWSFFWIQKERYGQDKIKALIQLVLSLPIGSADPRYLPSNQPVLSATAVDQHENWTFALHHSEFYIPPAKFLCLHL